MWLWSICHRWYRMMAETHILHMATCVWRIKPIYSHRHWYYSVVLKELSRRVLGISLNNSISTANSVIYICYPAALTCLSLISTAIIDSSQPLMRLWCIWLIIIFIFMAFTCNSCQESFKNKQGLSKHQWVCAKVKQTKIEGLEWQRKHQQETVSVEPEILGDELEELNHVRQILFRNWTLDSHRILGSW